MRAREPESEEMTSAGSRGAGHQSRLRPQHPQSLVKVRVRRHGRRSLTLSRCILATSQDRAPTGTSRLGYLTAPDGHPPPLVVTGCLIGLMSPCRERNPGPCAVTSPALPPKQRRPPFLGPHQSLAPAFFLACPFRSTARLTSSLSQAPTSPTAAGPLAPTSSLERSAPRGQLTPPGHSDRRQQPLAMLISANKASCAAAGPAAPKILTELS